MGAATESAAVRLVLEIRSEGGRLSDKYTTNDSSASNPPMDKINASGLRGEGLSDSGNSSATQPLSSGAGAGGGTKATGGGVAAMGGEVKAAGGGVDAAGGTTGGGGLGISVNTGLAGGTALAGPTGGAGADDSWPSEDERSSVKVEGCEATGAAGMGATGAGVTGSIGRSATGATGGVGGTGGTEAEGDAGVTGETGATGGVWAAGGAGASAALLNTRRCFKASNSVGVRAPASSISLSWRNVSRGEDGLFMSPEYGPRGG